MTDPKTTYGRVTPRTVEELKAIVGDRFVSVYCNASLEVCEARDDQGLYSRAKAGEVRNVTGVDAPYEPPENPDFVLDTAERPLEENVASLLEGLDGMGHLTRG